MASSQERYFRLAHLSDLHFGTFSYHPAQLFSKRWIGNVNLFFSRRHSFTPHLLDALIPLLTKAEVDGVVITGDLTTTSYGPEFELARQFANRLKEAGFQVFCLPGNHDHYTKSAYKKRQFYHYFPSAYSPPVDPLTSLTLKEDGITAASLGNNWWLIALDTAFATSLISANGLFSEDLEKKLEAALHLLGDDQNVILMNHFPLFENETPRKALFRKEALRALLERFPKIKLYLHGHSHRHCIADLRASGLPIILDSGSTAQRRGGTFHLIDITPQGCAVEVYKRTDEQWKKDSLAHFTW
jgi:3',5'-cyclic AMP phosphodiesterase CpdA